MSRAQIPYPLSACALLYDAPPGRRTLRIQLPVKIADASDPVLFVMDTGSPSGILWRRDIVVRGVEVSPEEHFSVIGDDVLEWVGGSLRGALYRVPLTFIAEQGRDVTVEAPFFVPAADEDYNLALRSFIGLSALERIFFACDLYTETFYFAPYR